MDGRGQGLKDLHLPFFSVSSWHHRSNKSPTVHRRWGQSGQGESFTSRGWAGWGGLYLGFPPLSPKDMFFFLVENIVVKASQSHPLFLWEGVSGNLWRIFFFDFFFGGTMDVVLKLFWWLPGPLHVQRLIRSFRRGSWCDDIVERLMVIPSDPPKKNIAAPYSPLQPHFKPQGCRESVPEMFSRNVAYPWRWQWPIGVSRDLLESEYESKCMAGWIYNLTFIYVDIIVYIPSQRKPQTTRLFL